MAASESQQAQLIENVPHLRAFAHSLCRDAVRTDDLVQETILKAWSSFDKFEQGTNMRAWLFTILRNTFYSEHRKGRREVEDVDGLYAAQVVQPPQQQGMLARRDFEQAFATLPADQREALTLVGASGLSYEDAAVVCEVAVGTMKSRVNRARERLSALLSEDQAEDAPESSPAE